MVADPLVRLLYGAAFAGAAPALSWLVVLAGARVSTGLVVDAMLARGRSRFVVLLQLAWLGAVVPALVVGARLGGITGVAVAHAAVAVAVAAPLHVVAAGRLHVDGRALAGEVLRPLVASAVGLSAGLASTQLVTEPWARLLLPGAVVAGAYALVLGPGRLRRLGAPAPRARAAEA